MGYPETAARQRRDVNPPLSAERFAQGGQKINTYLTIPANSLALGLNMGRMWRSVSPQIGGMHHHSFVLQRTRNAQGNDAPSKT